MGVEVHEQTIEAPPADVWGFMVDPAALSAWFGADAWLEPVVGGSVLFRFADGSVRRGVVEQVERSHMLTWRWREHRGAGFGMELGEPSRVTIELEPVDGGTLVRITESLPADGGRLVTDPDPVFEALADPTRRAVIRALADEGPTTLSSLSRQLPITRQAVAKHLVVLQDAGLVAGSGPVRGRVYTFTPRPLTDAMDWIVDVGAGWDDRLARLKHQVERGR